VGIEKFGLKIPMRPFFAATGATLAFMAFVFAGDGVKELQEGGYIHSTVLSWAPRADFFGIYPTVESLAVQLVIALALLFGLLWTFVIAPSRRPPAASPLERRGRSSRARKSAGV
jgi:high-affinity iron transporter